MEQEQTCTEPQRNFWTKLISERPNWAAKMQFTPETINGLTIKRVSELIDLALRNPKETSVEVQPHAGMLKFEEIEAGSYWTEHDGIARVRKARGSGRLYAESLVCHAEGLPEESYKFQYVKGLIYRLKRRMTLEEAKAWGARHGMCCICGKLLTDAKSIAQGIGPVCITKV